MGCPTKTTLFMTCLLGLAAACGDASTGGPARAVDAAPGSFAGVVRLGADVAPEDYAALLIMGRKDPADPLPDMLLRLSAAPLPREFVLDARHMLAPGTVSGEWYLSARLDADGELLAARGDVTGTLGPLRPGLGGLQLTLDTPVTQSDDPAGLQLPDGHPALDEPAAPRADPPPTAAPGHVQAVDPPPREEGPRLRGRIELADVHADRNGSGTLFLVLKSNPQARGMPRAAYRVDRPQFPLDFDLGPEHVPLQVENKADLLAGTLHLIARLDSDGDALTKQATDVVSDWLEVEFDQPDPVALTLDRSGP